MSFSNFLNSKNDVTVDQQFSVVSICLEDMYFSKTAEGMKFKFLTVLHYQSIF